MFVASKKRCGDTKGFTDHKSQLLEGKKKKEHSKVMESVSDSVKFVHLPFATTRVQR